VLVIAAVIGLVLVTHFLRERGAARRAALATTHESVEADTHDETNGALR
jgi:hypothetical protein